MRRVAVVLAAGAARRFGGGKMAADFAGEPLVHHAIRIARAAPVDAVFVVASQDSQTGEWQGSPRVNRIEIQSESMSASLAVGIAAAVAVGADGAFVFLGDMPLVPAGVAGVIAEAILDAFAAVPMNGTEPGHPVLFSARAFPDLLALKGDEGAGKLLRHRDDVVRVPIDDPGIRFDVDVPADISRLSGRPMAGDQESA